MTPHLVATVVLVTTTALLFGLVAYRRDQPFTARYTNAGTELTRDSKEALARRRALTRVIEVLAWACAVPTAVVLFLSTIEAML